MLPEKVGKVFTLFIYFYFGISPVAFGLSMGATFALIIALSPPFTGGCPSFCRHSFTVYTPHCIVFSMYAAFVVRSVW